MKSKKSTDDMFYVRYCWSCCSPMYYEHFLSWNPQERQSVLARIWNSPMVQILCCSCIEKGLDEFTPSQIEIKSFIEKNIGDFKYMLYFGPLKKKYREHEYHNTIPGRDFHLTIAKQGSQMEQIFRTKYKYKIILPHRFRTLINHYYHELSFSVISDIIGYERMIIEVPNKLAPATFSNPNHEFIAFLAPIIVDTQKKVEYSDLLAF